jgi:hypothetical protein
MVLNYLEDKASFLDKYNRLRPKAETAFGSKKGTIAHWLRGRNQKC